MEQSGSESRPFRVGVYPVPGFALMSYACTVEPLRAANLLSGKDLYDWRVITRDGHPLASSNGIRLMPDASIEAAMSLLKSSIPLE